jgi:flagellar L-ring protein precursor FlgH
MLDAASYRSLVSEGKAFRTGDILTVVVQEVSSATTAADSAADRKTSFGGEVGSSKVGIVSATAGASTDNSGGGRTQRSGRLAAQLSVRVVEVLPNSDLAIVGHQDIRVNGELQSITLTGVVRQRDIGENNTVLSGRIAGADIRFDGEGFVADKSRPGWITQFLTLLGF